MHPIPRLLVHVLWALCLGGSAVADAQDPPAVATTGERPLFAVEIRVGPAWDAARPAHEQVHFREHSANLKRLRDAGDLVMGARYSDTGLIVLAAGSEAAARAMMDADPSIAAGVFRYELHPMNVFYAGTVGRPAPCDAEP